MMTPDDRATLFALIRKTEQPPTPREQAALACARIGRKQIARALEAAGYSPASAFAAADVVHLVLTALESRRMASPLPGMGAD